MGEVTLLIAEARAGNREAFDKIFQLLYPELRKVAHRRLAGASRGPLETTALVNECYLKLAQREALTPADRAHFLAYSATVMRSIVVDAARAAQSDRRGGGVEPVPLSTEHLDTYAAPEEEILDVHAALEELGRVDPRLASVVEMRYFASMDDEAIGVVLNVSSRTVRRDWDKARLLLAHALRS